MIVENGVGARLRARWYLVLIVAIIAVAIGLTGEYTVNRNGVKSKSKPIGVGSAQLLVDSNPSTLATINSLNSDAQGLSARAPLFAEYATGTSIKTRIASLAGVPFDTLSVTAITDQAAPGQPAAAVPAASGPHIVTLTATAQSSVIRIATVSKQAAVAEKLAAATSTVLRNSVAKLAASEHIRPVKGQAPASKVVLKQLGAPIGGTVIEGGSIKKSVAYGVVSFLLLLLVVLAFDNMLLGRARRKKERAAQVSA
jgi:hypothetical protein